MNVGLPSPLPAPAPDSLHVPERSCVACRARRPQAELLRLTRVDGQWQHLGGARTGRGSYLCADNAACWAEKKLRRAFGAQAPALSAQLHARPHPPKP